MTVRVPRTGPPTPGEIEQEVSKILSGEPRATASAADWETCAREAQAAFEETKERLDAMYEAVDALFEAFASGDDGVLGVAEAHLRNVREGGS